MVNQIATAIVLTMERKKPLYLTSQRIRLISWIRCKYLKRKILLLSQILTLLAAFLIRVKRHLKIHVSIRNWMDLILFIFNINNFRKRNLRKFRCNKRTYNNAFKYDLCCKKPRICFWIMMAPCSCFPNTLLFNTSMMAILCSLRKTRVLPKAGANEWCGIV